jgi:hypothetical protein
MRWSRVLAGVYAALCLGALTLIPISSRGWFGVEPDPLAGVAAIVLAMPWSFALQWLPGGGPWPGMLVVLAGMAANVGVMLWLGRVSRRRL